MTSPPPLARRARLLPLAFSRCLSFLLAVGATDVSARARPPEHNVVCITIDGIRNLEGFLAPVAAEETHPYIPRMWSELKPNGTVFTNLLMVEKASTTRGINTVYSGAWNHGPNRGTQVCACDHHFLDNRSLAPLLGEHVVRDLGVRRSGVSYYNGKRNGLVSDYSFHPGYGRNFRPGIAHFVNAKAEEFPFFTDLESDGILEFSDGTNSDDLLIARMKSDLAFSADREEYPSLVLCHLGVVDLAGHRGQFSLYADSIRNADDEIASFWNYLQSHPHYRDRTTLIVTTDHGRHDDEHGGFRNHGGSCRGCRNLFFLAIGPRTPANQVVTRAAFMVDIAPTMARLLGFPLPFAEGKVLPEVVGSADPIVQRVSHTAAIGWGSNVVVSATRVTRTDHSRVFCWVGTPGSSQVSFGPGIPVSGDPSLLANRPAIASSSHRGSLLMSWRELDDATGRWRIRAAESLNGGLSFSSPRNVLVGRREVDHPPGYRKPQRPAIQPLADRDVFLVPLEANTQVDHVLSISSSDGFLTDADYGTLVRNQADLPAANFAMVDSVGLSDGGYALSWVQINRNAFDDPTQTRSWDVFFRRVRRTGRLDPILRLTEDPAPSLDPCLLLDKERNLLHVVYANQIGQTWQVLLRSSPNSVDWGPAVQVTQSKRGAWKPSAIVLSDGDLQIAYEDHDTGLGDIWTSRYSPSTQMTGSLVNLSASARPSCDPVICWVPDSGAACVVWSELDPDARFTIHGRKVP